MTCRVLRLKRKIEGRAAAELGLLGRGQLFVGLTCAVAQLLGLNRAGGSEAKINVGLSSAAPCLGLSPRAVSRG